MSDNIKKDVLKLIFRCYSCNSCGHILPANLQAVSVLPAFSDKTTKTPCASYGLLKKKVWYEKLASKTQLDEHHQESLPEISIKSAKHCKHTASVELVQFSQPINQVWQSLKRALHIALQCKMLWDKLGPGGRQFRPSKKEHRGIASWDETLFSQLPLGVLPSRPHIDLSLSLLPLSTQRC